MLKSTSPRRLRLPNVCALLLGLLGAGFFLYYYENFMSGILVPFPGSKKINTEAESTRLLGEWKEQVRRMFFHGWDSYLKYAIKKTEGGNVFYHDVLDPLTCTGANDQGEYSLTLIDAADTLAVMGEVDRFREAISLISNIPNFDLDIQVSVFETGIRILGGLISNHANALKLLNGSYNGHLLRLATEIGDKLLRAFDTPTQIPFNQVYLIAGKAPRDETLCVSCAGSIILEFGYLTHYTQDPKYYRAAKAAMVAIFNRRSNIGLLGSMISSTNGQWRDYQTSIASMSDSYYEYLWKAYLVFGDEDFHTMFVSLYESVERATASAGLHYNVDMTDARPRNLKFTGLECYWGGIQVQFGDLKKARLQILTAGHLTGKFGFVPEGIGLPSYEFYSQAYKLRPEFAESVYFMSTAYPSEFGLIRVAEAMMNMIEKNCRTDCGYAQLLDITKLPSKWNIQHSFLLSETFKYLYLIFDTTNPLRYTSYSFNTEAHPLRAFTRSKFSNFRKAKLIGVKPPKADHFSKQVCDFKEWLAVRDELSFSTIRNGYNWTPNEIPSV